LTARNNNQRFRSMKQVEDLTHQIGALQIALTELKESHATLQGKHDRTEAELELTEKKVWCRCCKLS
jgi:prefoldin subunit 5